MSFVAEVIGDNVSPDDVRITTHFVRFPRIILAEVDTHRDFSRNFESSRAVPVEVKIKQALEDPFIPLKITAARKGMAGASMSEKEAEKALAWWLYARDDAVRAAQQLLKIGVHKQHANRILEPFMWISGVITSTEWDNFFALRAPEGDEVDFDFGAQPEFQQLAIMMRENMRLSRPNDLDYGLWHTPGLTVFDNDRDGWSYYEEDAWWSAGKMARVSYDNVWKGEEKLNAIGRAEKLAGAGHYSPLEQPAMCMPLMDGERYVKIEPTGFAEDGYMVKSRDWHGNFFGWRQLRKFQNNEHNYGLVSGREAVAV